MVGVDGSEGASRLLDRAIRRACGVDAEELLAGSVSQRMVHRARCPVVVMPAEVA